MYRPELLLCGLTEKDNAAALGSYFLGEQENCSVMITCNLWAII